MLKDFYENIALTHQVFSNIDSENKKILKKEAKKEKVKEETRHHKPEVNYLLSFVDNPYRYIVLKLFEKMEELNFRSKPSVGSHFIAEFAENNNEYDNLAKINLYAHTVNCCVETVDLLSEVETPKDAIGISLIISILHDFGKHDTLKNTLGKPGEQHHKISAKFAKDFLEKLQEEKTVLISDDLIETVSEVISEHHDKHVKYEQFGFLGILKQADHKARRSEVRLLKKEGVNK